MGKFKILRTRVEVLKETYVDSLNIVYPDCFIVIKKENILSCWNNDIKTKSLWVAIVILVVLT